jgi:Prolyl oligopeptidase family
MKHVLKHSIALLAVAPLSGTGADNGTSSSAAAPISVEDVAEQVVIGDPNALSWNDTGTKISSVSGDGKYVAVVIRHGDVKTGRNDADLLVYETDHLMQSPVPHVVAHFSSATNYQPIAKVQWLADNKSLVFAGSSGASTPQVYEARLGANASTQLTHESGQMEWFGVSPSGEWVVTATYAAPKVLAEDPECLSRGCRVTATNLYDAQRQQEAGSAHLTRYAVHQAGEVALNPPEASDPDLIDCWDKLEGGVSPDGRYGLRMCKLRPHQWPEWWEAYATAPELPGALRGGVNGFLRQWVLVDFLTKQSTRLGDAPFYVSNLGASSQPVWIDQGKRVLIAGAFDSLANVSGEVLVTRAHRYSIVSINPGSLKTEVVGTLDPRTLHVTKVAWNDKSQELRVETVDSENRPLPSVIVARLGGRWVQRALTRRASDSGLPPPSSKRPYLTLEQSANSPPLLVATDPRSRRQALVLDPNPWLKTRRLGRVEAVSWTSKDGSSWHGDLYYPIGYESGTRYPVVLQTHGEGGSRFSLSGAARNFAAQPLAGIGILVLQVDENLKGVLGSKEEWPAVQSGYESAIDYLDNNGLIDPKRVGIQGWSRSGAWTGYTITHSNYPFAAVALTESSDYGWWAYVADGASHGESTFGAAPLKDGLDIWRRMSPTFNVDRVSAPMLMWASNVVGLWDWYVLLRRYKKPVEYWLLQDATHDVFRVPERLVANQLVVDWFRFWLLNDEDKNPNKAEQYKRWAAFREQQDSSRKLLSCNVQMTKSKLDAPSGRCVATP